MMRRGSSTIAGRLATPPTVRPSPRMPTVPTPLQSSSDGGAEQDIQLSLGRDASAGGRAGEISESSESKPAGARDARGIWMCDRPPVTRSSTPVTPVHPTVKPTWPPPQAAWVPQGDHQSMMCKHCRYIHTNTHQRGYPHTRAHSPTYVRTRAHTRIHMQVRTRARAYTPQAHYATQIGPLTERTASHLV